MSFILLKFFGFFTQLLAMFIILVLIGWLLLLKNNKRGHLLIGFGLLFIFLVSWGPFPALLITPLEHRCPNVPISEPIDGIIVLGGGFARIEKEKVVLGSLDRIISGMQLARQHPEADLILSGGNASILKQRYKEAEEMKNLLVKLGLSRNRILVEPNSRNTHESALETAKLFSDFTRTKQKGKWVLITSAFHMPRAIGCFQKAGIYPIPFSVDYRGSQGLDLFSFFSPDNIIKTAASIKEWAALFIYKQLGYTNEYFPSAKGLRITMYE